MMARKENLLDECYQRSLGLLRQNANRYGFMAAAPSGSSRRYLYTNIFGRDASITALGAIASGNKNLIAHARQSLLTLAEYQTDLGQIPFSIDPKNKSVIFYHLGSIDSTLWWLLSLAFYDKNTADKTLANSLRANSHKALNWLFFQDTNNCSLLEQGEASDWADMMPANGNVLYSNVLWYKMLGDYRLIKAQSLVANALHVLFLPHEYDAKRWKNIKRVYEWSDQIIFLKKSCRKIPYYLHFVSYRHGSDRFDVYGNLLAIIFGLADDSRARKILDYAEQEAVNRPFPIKALTPPIKPDDHDWREYLETDKRGLNRPHTYHNGGVWPYIGSFYAMALYKLGRKEDAWQALAEVARANSLNGWQFNEWFHGRTGKPRGMAGQTWNAGTYLLAHRYLSAKINF
ncbi:glycoside hydrolase [Candidatus Falkowbacteria bacterium CG_4_10_14_0_2_um_filter_48_10]|uniref:beta-fructofuranosidase n=1 Tax=Candidatus Falkowbacteria bacterium CG23_combo_of_CG06-09_8_20_14_all_49_15 TaxID=1974572 RepID=A0A2G9ZJT7_9BACT|nr:MAG: glycoside hydrolase [Candidatus Falkowbacteria bacterium CG23_combo_of_CG06-09_8_20_14_all_49_15]PJA08913.1 MAG: glycoside hydrolase [Candidatus Falkowbacteria bacterium CG_4_10_14_0_2_um_filter_48_10]